MSFSHCLSASELERLFPGDSELAGRMRALDWSRTDLGSPQSWPENLRTAVSLCLTSRIPVVMYWGPTFTVLYNDPYISFLGETKHPRFLGRPGRECWSEIWETIGPMLEGVRATGNATWSEDLLMFFARRLPREEVYVRFTFGPILAADGRTVDGIFCPCTETTEQVVGARRLETLRKLGVKPGEARAVEAACREAAGVLGENPQDIPFAAIYLVDGPGEHARLRASARLVEGVHPLPLAASPDEDEPSFWPLASVLRSGRASETAELGAFASRFPDAAEPASKALVLPIPAPTHERLAGLLVAGVSPRRVLDSAYQTFFDLVAGQIGTAIADAMAYEAERRRAEALAELDRAKTAFFSNVSHEFRTPLTLMLGPVAELLSRSYTDLSPAAKGQLEVVNRNGLRLLRLVNTLLDFSRIEAGRVQAVYEPTDLSAFTVELASVFRAAVERAGLQFVVDCPKLSEPVFVDREMWEKIVLNLLSNAFKFTFEGEIAVMVRQVESTAELRVRDTGTGIPAEEIPRLFERFHRVRSAQGRTHEGTGIGLSLAQELARLHGGTIRVESAIGQGSTFIVTLPLGIAHLPADQLGSVRSDRSTAVDAAPFVEEALRWLPDDAPTGEDPLAGLAMPHEALAVPSPSAEGGGADRRRVLVADDNADMRRYLVRLLSERYEVAAVPDGEAALATARERPPDLVLTDVMMPRLDGFGLLRELRADPRTRDLPVILLSARAGEESRVEGMEAGADDYLVKPFSARELLARVGAHLQMARLRREAEEALRESRELLRVTLASIGDAVITTDLKGRVTYLNAVAESLTGWTQAEAEGHSLEEVFRIVNEQTRRPVENPATKALREGVVVGLANHTVLIRKDGPERPIDDSAAPIADEAGRVAGCVLIFRDVTERRRTDAALRESEQQLAADLAAVARMQQVSTRLVQAGDFSTLLHEILDAAIEITRADLGNIQLLEGGSLKIVAQRGFEAPFLDFFNAVHEGQAACGSAMQRGERMIVEDVANSEIFSGTAGLAVMLAANAQAVQSTPLVSRSGRVLGMFSTHYHVPHRPDERALRLLDLLARQAADLIERTQAEIALRESETRFRTLADHAPVLIWVNGPSGCEFVNRSYLDFLGVTLEEIQGMGWAKFVHPEDYEAYVGGYVGAAERRAVFESELRFRRADGVYRIMKTVALPRLSAAGDFLGYVGCTYDITDVKEAERRKNEFLAMLAHELRNPLAPIKNALHLIRLKGGDGESIRAASEMMERQVGQMVRLVDDLLDVSRISRGKIELRKERVELAEVVHHALESVRPLCETMGHELTVTLPPPPLYLNADPTRLAQVLGNLLSNACKFTEEAGRVWLIVEREDRQAVIRVQDAGIGIAAEQLAEIFEMFTQVDTSLERLQSGLGIGLTLVKTLVELHDGTVEASSRGIGQGSEFVVRLPLAPSGRVPGARYPVPGGKEPAVPSIPPGTAAKPRRILVVDDNLDSADSLAMLLELDGHELHTAHDGLEALAAAATFHPDVILLDIGLPRLNGYEVARRMREQSREGCPVLVALTGWGQEEDRQKSRDAGFHAHMVKPVDHAALTKLLAELPPSPTSS